MGNADIAIDEKRTTRTESVSYKYYVLIILTLVYALNFLDRTIFNVLIEPIKKEFALSDTLIGLLAGFGFVLLYAVFGIPIARLADRTNRKWIVVVGLTFWSAMTTVCGTAQNVVVLALARIGVGIGESAGPPASQSLISSLFTSDQRPRALGIYALGTYLGIFLGYFIGGWVNHYYGWRVAFITAGLPGIMIAVAIALTVREPISNRPPGPGTAQKTSSVFSYLFQSPTFLLVLVGFWLTGFTNYATSVWIPPFLARVHHLSSAEVGTYSGTFKGLFGMAGTLLGGFVVERLAKSDKRWKLWAPAIMSALGGPALVWCLLTPSTMTAVWALGLFSFLVGFHLGPIFSVCQSIARASMRSTASAIVLLSATCVGQGLGPLTVGVLNDLLKPSYQNDAVRYSMMSAALASVAGACLFAIAAKSIRQDLARAESE